MTGKQSTSSRVLDAVQNLAPEIENRAEETERNRGIAPDLMDKLKAAGMFRMMIPAAYGGAELTLRQACQVIEELARADAAAGWTAMVAFGFNIAYSRFPRETVAELFRDGADVTTRGALAPLGAAIPTDGGYIISGKWPFASGSYDPQWVAAGCIVMEGGGPRIGPDGVPEMLLALLPASDVQFLDTWYSVGLRGSDSTDFVVDQRFAPKAFTTNLFNPFTPSSFDTAQFQVPFGFLTGPTHSSVCIGIVQGALDDLATLARTKRSAFNPTQRLAEDVVFQHRFGELLVRLDAIRGLTEKQISEFEATLTSAAPLAPVDFARNAARVGYVHVQSVDIVNEAFSLAGSTPVYSSSALQRRWRDVRCVAQHFGGSTAQYRALGALTAGEGAQGPLVPSSKPEKAVA